MWSEYEKKTKEVREMGDKNIIGVIKLNILTIINLNKILGECKL